MFKKMKRSLLISTVLMVVLSVVALSTATFAWFTANDTVSASTATMTAANATSANIGIGWSIEQARAGTSIEFNDLQNLAPMVPKNKPSDGKNNAGNYEVAQFISTSETEGITGTLSFSGQVTPEEESTPYLNDVPGFDDFDYTPDFSAVDSLNIIDIANMDAAHTITKSALALANDTYGLGATEATFAADSYKRLYKTVSAANKGFVIRGSNLPITGYTTSEFYYNFDAAVAASLSEIAAANYSEVNYLTIVANTATPSGSEIKVNDVNTATAGVNDSYAVTATDANIGDYLFLQDSLTNTYDLLDAQPAQAYSADAFGDVYIADAFGAGINFKTVLTTAGKVDVGDIHLTDARTLVAQAAAGEKLYCIRKATTTATAATTLASFTATNYFTTGTTNNEYRFQDGTISGMTPATLSQYVDVVDDENPPPTTFYLINNNGAGGANATIKVTATGITATGGRTGLIRIAIFAKVPGADNLVYMGTMTGDKDASVNQLPTYYGSLYTDMLSTSLSGNFKSFNATKPSDGLTLGTLQPGQSLELSAVVWMEGLNLNNAASGTAVSFKLSFSVVTGVTP